MFAYIGGKYNIGKWIFEQLPKDHHWDRYTEVFGGAMWVYIKRAIISKEYHYNDFNPFLYNLWRCITEKREEFLEFIKDVQPNDKPYYKECNAYIKEAEINKDEWLPTVPNIEIAEKYIYLATNSFSGIIGAGMRLKVDQYSPFKKRLYNPTFTNKLDKITQVHNMDFRDIIKKNDCENGLFYIDPPYLGKEHLYSFHNFDLEGHKELAEMLKSIKSCWILSYYDEEYLRPLYSDNVWIKKEFARSSVHKYGKDGKKGEEVLILSKSLVELGKNKKALNVFFK